MKMKDKRWRQMRLQKKREKQRIRKQAKPVHERDVQQDIDAVTVWDRMWSWIGPEKPVEKSVIDKRKRRQQKRIT